MSPLMYGMLLGIALRKPDYTKLRALVSEAENERILRVLVGAESPLWGQLVESLIQEAKLRRDRSVAEAVASVCQEDLRAELFNRLLATGKVGPLRVWLELGMPLPPLSDGAIRLARAGGLCSREEDVRR